MSQIEAGTGILGFGSVGTTKMGEVQKGEVQNGEVQNGEAQNGVTKFTRYEFHELQIARVASLVHEM